MAFARSLTNNITTVTTVRTGSANGDVLIGMRIANRTAAAIKASAYITFSGNDYYLVGGPTNSTMGADIPVGGAMIVINGDIDKVVLASGDLVRVVASAAADCVVSALEN